MAIMKNSYNKKNDNNNNNKKNSNSHISSSNNSNDENDNNVKSHKKNDIINNMIRVKRIMMKETATRILKLIHKKYNYKNIKIKYGNYWVNTTFTSHLPWFTHT